LEKSRDIALQVRSVEIGDQRCTVSRRCLAVHPFDQSVDLLGCGSQIGFVLVDKVLNAFDQLRNDQKDQQEKDQKQYKIREEQRKSSAKHEGGYLFEELFFKESEKGIEQIGKHQADQNGTEQQQERADPMGKGIDVRDKEQEHENRDVDGNCDPKTVLFGFFL